MDATRPSRGGAPRRVPPSVPVWSRAARARTRACASTRSAALSNEIGTTDPN